MIQKEELKKLAQDRVKEAKLLSKNGYQQGAYYLAGYGVEFALKAVICQRLGVEVFAGGDVSGEVTKALKEALQTHYLPTLLVFAGLFPVLESEKIDDENLFKDWSKVSEWKVERRYEPLSCSEQTVINFINASERVMQWILKHY